MISAARDAREQILRAAGKADDLVREHRPADEHVIVLDEQPVERDRHVLVQSPACDAPRSRAAGIMPSFTNVDGIVPPMVEDPPVPPASPFDHRPADVTRNCASLIGECVPSATR